MSVPSALVLAAGSQPVTPLEGAYWVQLVGVLAVAVVAAGVLVGAYSTGILLWARAERGSGADGTAILPRIGAVLCFVVAVSVILYGIYLIVPYFHAN